MANYNFKVADSIFTDEDDYAFGCIESIEFDTYTNDDGEVTERILMKWATKTTQGKDTTLRRWFSISINPKPKKIDGTCVYDPLTQLLLLHEIISVDDLKKLAKHPEYIDQIDINLELLIGSEHKFKLDYMKNGLARPEIATLKIIKDLRLGVSKVTDNKE